MFLTWCLLCAPAGTGFKSHTPNHSRILSFSHLSSGFNAIWRSAYQSEFMHRTLCFLDHCESMMACTFISCTITHVRFFPSLKTTMHPLQPCKNRAPFLIIHQRNDVTKTYIDEPPIFFLWSSSLPRSRPCQVCVDKVCTPSRNQHANVTHT